MFCCSPRACLPCISRSAVGTAARARALCRLSKLSACLRRQPLRRCSSLSFIRRKPQVLPCLPQCRPWICCCSVCPSCFAKKNNNAENRRSAVFCVLSSLIFSQKFFGIRKGFFSKKPLSGGAGRRPVVPPPFYLDFFTLNSSLHRARGLNGISG